MPKDELMSSNIKIERTCEFCGAKFIAQTTVTRFCSKRCAERSYKARMKEEKIQRAQTAPPSNLSTIKEKDFLTVAEVGQLLGMTRQGVYKLIHRGDLVASKLSSRLTLIKKESISAMLDAKPYEKKEPIASVAAITDFYSIREIMEKYKVSSSWVFRVLAEKKVPKTIQRGKGYYSKAHIDRIFSEKKPSPEITEWYTVTDIQRKYDMTLSAIYSLVSKIGIPKKKEAGQTFYSKYHFDVAKGAASKEDEQYISVAEAMEIYNVTRDQLYHYVKTYKITRIKCGKYVKLSAKELADIFTPRIEL